VSQSVSRALQLLEALRHSPASLDELAAVVGVHKTTVLRLLRTLESSRFVMRDDRHRYSLGSGLFELANSALEQVDVRTVSRPHLESLNGSTGHTVHLAILEAGEIVYIDKLDSVHGVRLYSRIGLRAPIHCTAVGKVLVASLPAAARARLANSVSYPIFTPKTIGTATAYLGELDTVIGAGYALDSEEHEVGISCIAAPVRDGSGAAIAAASVTVPLNALGSEGILGYLPAVRSTATAISADLGWRGRYER
jgi:DNA-binding IclR family transcriptional regulator